MKKITDVEEIHSLLNEILVTLKKYCEKNNILFSLVGGTLLGAIRHKGFIPWDDDIDVTMLRTEYNKFIDLIRKNPYIDEDKRYKVLLPLEENHIYPYIKIIDTYTIVYEKNINKKYATGLWIDVFPYDYGANNFTEVKKIYKINNFYKKFFQVGISGELSFKKKVLKMIAYPFYKLFTKGDYRYWVNKLLHLPTAHKTEMVGNIVWIYSLKDIYPAKWFNEYIDVTFEGETYKALSCYDEYLTQLYGDYMKLPKEEDRVFHGFECYYIKKNRQKK